MKKLVLREYSRGSWAREVLLDAYGGCSFLQRQQAEPLDLSHDGVFYLTPVEIAKLIQWYLKVQYNHTIFLPGTDEYLAEEAAIEERRQKWAAEIVPKERKGSNEPT